MGVLRVQGLGSGGLGLGGLGFRAYRLTSRV